MIGYYIMNFRVCTNVPLGIKLKQLFYNINYVPTDRLSVVLISF